MIQPGLERHPQLSQPSEARSECRVAIQSRWRSGRSRRRDAGVVSSAVANTFEAALPGLGVRRKNRIDAVSQQAVGMADNAGAGAQASVRAFGFAGYRGDELSFADGLHLLRAIRPVFGSALDEHRGDDIV